jgi:hypothetical protein
MEAVLLVNKYARNNNNLGRPLKNMSEKRSNALIETQIKRFNFTLPNVC